MRKTLTPEKIREVLSHLTPYWRELFVFQWDTGCRVSEALTLTWECISEGGYVVDIRPHELPDGTHWKPKRPSSVRQVELDRPLIRTHAVYRPQGSVFFPWVWPGNGVAKLPTYNGALAALRTAAAKAGVDKIGTHDLRRARITQALAAGGDPNTVRAAAGHASLKSTIKYVCHVPLRTKLPAADAAPVANPAAAQWAAALNPNKWR